MSYQIYYDRAFIRIGDKFIPIANSGSNNCFEYYNGREVPEKSWNVLNWKRDYQFLFSESEIKDIARDYELNNQKFGIDFKSRNRWFESGEFERWIINGMKNAYTVEEYVSFGNRFYVLDYSHGEIEKWKEYFFKTTPELMKILDDLKDVRSKNIKLWDNREVYRPKLKRNKKKPLRAADLPEYYVLKGDINGSPAYFIKLNRKSAIRYLPYFTSGFIKIFKTERNALSYLKKYQFILNRYKFTPEKITKTV
jgi:hypothetical protein